MNRNGLLLWILGGAGVVLTYAAVKNVTPQSILLTALGNGGGTVPINPDGAVPPTTVISSSTGRVTGTEAGEFASNKAGELAQAAKGVGGYAASPKTQITGIGKLPSWVTPKKGNGGV